MIYAMNITSHPVPRTYKDAISCPNASYWIKAVQEEVDSLLSHDTWDIVVCPPDTRPVGCKWVFAIKEHSDGSIARYKARLVAQGFSQTEGVDFDEVFSPVAKYTSLRILLATIAQYNLLTRQLDFVTAFLNVKLQETIYMRLPAGYQVPDAVLRSFPPDLHQSLVCRLKGGLYGLKQ